MKPAAYLTVVTMLAGCVALPASTRAEGEQAEAPARCAGLAGLALPDGVEITSASIVRAGPIDAGTTPPQTVHLPEHCLVQGMINRRKGAGGVEYGIGFELRLPTDWNGRFLLQGGGGLNGSVLPAIGPVAAGAQPALAHGFAVASHDSGHKGATFDPGFLADQRAALDFAEAAVPRVTQVARDLTARFYGRSPHHSYMAGCSTGGREGMLASQRYPELFDGIVIGAPAMRPGYSNLAAEYAQMLLNRTLPAGDSGPATFSAAERATIHREVLRQCDRLDGLADGIIMDVEGCRAFDPSALRCAPGHSAGCIAPVKVEALRLGMEGSRDAAGRPTYASYPWDTGITWDGPGLPGFVRVGQPGPFGTFSTAREMDVDARVHAIRWDAAGRLTDTPYWTNLNTYLEHGGKLMFFHGVSDPWFSAFDTWDYFQRAREANGAEAWDDAARFYMVPGMMHCSYGDAFERFDLLSKMVAWVEEGAAPANIVASRADRQPGERPLCPHPSYARYTGGDPLSAASFACAAPDS